MKIGYQVLRKVRWALILTIAFNAIVIFGNYALESEYASSDIFYVCMLLAILVGHFTGRYIY